MVVASNSSSAAASRRCQSNWYRLMLAYSLLKLGTAANAFGTILAHASSVRSDIKRFFRESVHNHFLGPQQS